MVTRTSRASVLALWLLIDEVLSQNTIRISPSPTNSAQTSESTFVSPTLNQNNGGDLSEDQKIGVSIGVTFGVIILIGSAAILCAIRRRHKALARPESRIPGPDDIDDDNIVSGDGPGKGREVYYMSPAPTAQQGTSQQSPNGTIYQTGGYPATPEQTYAPQQQAHAMQYPTTYLGETYAYSGTMVLDPSQQNGYAGPSNTPYQPETYLQPQQQQQSQPQQGSHISWMYPVSEATPVEDFQYKYLQDYQPQMQNPCADQSQHRDGDTSSNDGHKENTYYVPPPRPNASELPDQRKPVELMGEGHYKEAP